MRYHLPSVVLFLCLAGLKLSVSMAAKENPCPSDDPPVAAYDCCHADQDAVIQDCPSPLSCLNMANDPPPCEDGYTLSADGTGCVRACNTSDFSCMCLPAPGVCYNNSQVPPEGASDTACCQGSDIDLPDLPHPEFWEQYLDDEPGVGECTLKIMECDFKNITNEFCCFGNYANGTTYDYMYSFWGHGEPETGGIKYHGAESTLLCNPNAVYDEDAGNCYDYKEQKYVDPVDTVCFKAA